MDTFILLTLAGTVVIGSVCGIVAVIKVIRSNRRLSRLQQHYDALEKRFVDLSAAMSAARSKESTTVTTEPIPEPVVTPSAVSVMPPIQMPPTVDELAPVMVSVQETTIETSESMPKEEIEDLDVEPVFEQVEPVEEDSFEFIEKPSPEYSAPFVQADMESAIVSDDVRSAVVEEPVVSPWTVSRPAVSSEEPESQPMDLETRIGAVWFNRIGLVILIISFALLGRMIQSQLQPWHKVAMSYLGSAALFALGWFYEKKLRQFARPVMAGGLALAFFTSFAGHFLPPMACMSLGASLTLMSLGVGGILLCAERWRSESTALLAIFLGHTAAFTAGGDAATYSLVAILFLSITALLLFLRHDWMPLNLFAVCAAYISHVVWMEQDHPASSQEFSFWFNFAFLTSYYTIFLFADIIYNERLSKQGKAAFSLRQRIAGRSVGPVSLIFYITITAALFLATKVYWNQIHFFLIPLAVVQTIVLAYHQLRRNTDYPIYAAFATIFLTLGLFSWFGGLSLNVILAAEALLLLIMARWIRLWYLNPLAQCVIVINFIHFWNSDACLLPDWPAYFGSLGTALIYFVKARLEETWRQSGTDEEEFDVPWVVSLRNALGRLLPRLSYIDALAGGWLVVYQNTHFFGIPAEESVIAGITLGIVIFTLTFGSRTFIPAIWLLHISAAVLLLQRPGFTVTLFGLDVSADTLEFWKRYFWIHEHLLVSSIALCALAAVYLAYRRGRPLYYLMGLGSFIISTPAISVICRTLRPEIPSDWIVPVWAVGPVAFWFAAPLFDRKNSLHEWTWSGGIWGYCEKRFVRHATAFAALFSILAILLTIRVITTITPSERIAVSILSILTFVYLSIVIRGNSPGMIFGLCLHAIITTIYHLNTFIETSVIDTDPLTCWIVTGPALAAVALIGFAPVKKQFTFFQGSLALLYTVTIAIGLMLFLHLSDFSPYTLWIGTAIVLWIAIESLRIITAKTANDFKNWTVVIDRQWLSDNYLMLCHFLSIVTAALLVGMTWRYFDSGETVGWIVILYAVLFAGTAAGLRSPTLGSASALFLIAAHGVYYALLHPKAGAIDHPYYTGSLVAITLIFGGGLERYIVSRKESISSIIRFWFNTGLNHGYALGFILGGLFLYFHGITHFNGNALWFPAQTLFPLITIIVACLLRLGMLQVTSLIFTIAWSLPRFVLFPQETADYRINLFYAGLLVFAQLLCMDRILAWQAPEIVGRIDQRLSNGFRHILVIISALFMLYVMSESDVLRGYWTTVGWSVLALLSVVLGFVWKDRIHRRMGLAIFVLAIGRVAFLDVARLEALYRMLAFMGLGASLIAVSFIYSRFRKEIDKWL